ncbi:D-xylose ABC transporter substrate-binding protein [Bordetella genomosp. 1]|uniref:D-xylose ABC transporter substrate-binding protein n=1 Tax=Bordetella genomosp. 1 TaxID=1395607 RepID=A0A261SGV2_9BORD|nr:D-xylose ABC transporter substrate-binding protein [Bordetella genomosp. 1]OZI36624.1 D-xylose ABC transporter substrate-binding protein [Bordetella genomosp. 1]
MPPILRQLLACAIALPAILSAGQAAHASKQAPVIGFSIDDLRVERWTRDRDYFVAAAKQLGAKVNVQSANASESRQIAQIENLIAQGVDALVIVPFNSKVLGNVIAKAHRAGIKVVAYDRLILDAPLDGYVLYDAVKIGELQAQALVDVVPKGHYFLLGGAPTDNNSRLLHEGQMKVLKPLVDKGDIRIVGDQWTPEWDPSKAQTIVENALNAHDNDIQAIVAANDGTAGGAIQALASQKLAGKVAVSGQDADLAAVRRISAGTQTMTIYKSLKTLAGAAAKMAVDLVQGRQPAFNTRLDNGKGEVESIMLTPVQINRENIDLLVKEGFFTAGQIQGK